MQRVPFHAAAIAAGVSTLLVACGGSSNDGGTPPPPPPAVLSVTGKAATGAALAGGAISAKCATGTGTAVASADGTYTVTITSGVLPCVLEATGTDSHGNAVTLHSVATTTTAQITPLTELLVAEVTGAAPSAVMNADLSTLSATFSATNVQAAQAKVVALLSAAGIETSTLGSDSLLSGTLTIGSATGYDHVLDLLGDSLAASGTALSTLTSTVVAQSTGGTGGGTASALAPELLLRPASPNCGSLRSGNYWVVTSASVDGDAAQLMRVDAPNGTITQVSDGSSSTLQANGTCRFTAIDPQLGATADIVVSPAGVIVARTLDSGNYKLAIGVPQQTHALSEAVGDWDTLFSDTSDTGDGWVFGYGRTTVASGTGGTTLQLQQGCQYAIGAEAPVCVANSPDSPMPLRPLTQANDGAFVEHSANDTDDGGPWQDKFFVYQAGNGEWFMVSSNIQTPNSSGDGSIGFATRHRTLSLPTAGATSNNWNVYMNTATQLSTNGVDANSHVIDSVDAASGTFVRTTGPTGAATHHETLAINNPIAGFQFRDGATGVATSDGGTTNVRRSIFLKVPGVGISVLYQPVQTGITANSRLVVSVEQPS